MLLPYRVKNPPRRFPVVTVIIIAVNVVVYALTTENFFMIREDVAKQYGFQIGISPLINFATAAFLHVDPLHLLGNMLFLWIFGPPVEGKLGRVGYVFAYFVTGFAGDVMQGLADKMLHGAPQLGIGASGCIMGIVGAYWYIFPWSQVCVVYWIGWFWRGITEVRAIWIIALYVALDIGEGVLFGLAGAKGGVANFAHVGGALLGVVLAKAMMVKRDTEAVSEAKAIEAETKDLSLVPLCALQEMLSEDPRNTRLLRAVAEAAMRDRRPEIVADAITRAGPGLIEEDASLVAWYLVDCRGVPTVYKPLELLRLARCLREAGDHVRSVGILEVIHTAFPTEPESERALYELATHYLNFVRQPDAARRYLEEMGRRFPNGPMTQFGRVLMNQIGANR